MGDRFARPYPTLFLFSSRRNSIAFQNHPLDAQSIYFLDYGNTGEILHEHFLIYLDTDMRGRVHKISIDAAGKLYLSHLLNLDLLWSKKVGALLLGRELNGKQLSFGQDNNNHAAS